MFARANIYMVIRHGEYTWIWLFARANLYGYSPGRIYLNLVIRPGEYIYGYSPGRIYMVIRPGEYIWLFARANILFQNTLEEMLRDRLVCGINDEQIQRRLLAESSLDFKKAMKQGI